MTTDYLSEIFRNAYTDTISEWQKQGFTDDEIIKKLNGSGLAVVMISHDARAIDNAKHILSLSENSFFFGTRQEYEEGGI